MCRVRTVVEAACAIHAIGCKAGRGQKDAVAVDQARYQVLNNDSSVVRGSCPGRTSAGNVGEGRSGGSIVTLHPVHNSVIRFNLRVQQDQAVFVARGPVGPGHDDFGLRAGADRDCRSGLDALADGIGVAD